MPSPTRRILVAEDSPTQAQQLRLLLESASYRVELAGDGREGLRRVRARPFDLVISDVVMPGLDGYGFCRAVKTEPETRDIPFVLLTGRRTPADIVRGLQHGADNFLTKPYDETHLLERLSRIFSNLERRDRGRFHIEVNLRVKGRDIVLSADKQQIVELLFATAEELEEASDGLERARQVADEYARTLERRAEERSRQLAEAEVRFRSLVENLPAVAYVTAVEEAGALFYISPRGQELLGVPALDLVSDPECFRRHLHPGDRDAVLEQRSRCLAEGRPFSAEYRLLAFDGRTIWVRDEAVPVPGPEAQGPLFQGVLLDVTERRRVEDDLRAQVRWLRSVVDGLGEGLVVAGRDGRLFTRNPEAARLLGMGPGAPPLEEWPDAYGIHRPDGGALLPAEELPLARALRGEAVEGVRLLLRQAGAGEGTAVVASGRPLRDDGGEVTAAVMALREVSAPAPAEAPATGHAAPVPVVEPGPPSRSGSVAAVPGRLLVVDDEEQVRALLREVLEMDGYGVEVAANGAVALEVLATADYDLVVSDLRMPELDGPALYRRVAAAHPDLRGRFVFLTGDSSGPETRAFLEETGCLTLDKPFTVEQALGVVREALSAGGRA